MSVSKNSVIKCRFEMKERKEENNQMNKILGTEDEIQIWKIYVYLVGLKTQNLEEELKLL